MLATGVPLFRLRHANVLRDGIAVLHDISWDLYGGEHWRFSGSNGSGKSTLARVLAGTLPIMFGGVLERNGKPGPFAVTTLKQHIALVSDEVQMRYSWNDTVHDVIAAGFFGSVGLIDTLDTAQETHVASLITRFGLEALAERPFQSLSSGQRRKVMIARSFTLRPQIYIADETTLALDAAAHQAFMMQLEHLAAAGTTLVVISHDETSIPQAITHELILHEGHIIQAGPRIGNDL